ncbi:unnamed protein product [Sphagnum compactum]
MGRRCRSGAGTTEEEEQQRENDGGAQKPLPANCCNNTTTAMANNSETVKTLVILFSRISTLKSKTKTAADEIFIATFLWNWCSRCMVMLV